MGLLAVDVTSHGVVMSADSQPVEIIGGTNRVLAVDGQQIRRPIVVRVGGGFVGLVGYAGTEQIEGVQTTQWLRRFSAAWPDDDVKTFCDRLAETLTGVWRRDGPESVLEILVTGEVRGDVQFWYVRNSRGLRGADWKHEPPGVEFDSVNDLDDNYVPRDAVLGETKHELLQRVLYSFRQGVLLPAAPVFDGFSSILGAIYAGRVEGIAPLASLDDVGYYARVRMEFLKRLCSAKHGIFDESTAAPVAGEVHVLGVGRDGRVAEYRKLRGQTQLLRGGRAESSVMTPVDEDEIAQRRAEWLAATLFKLGWERGAGATVWARVIEDLLALHKSAREQFRTNTANLEAWERLHSTALVLVVAIDQVLTFENRVRSLTSTRSVVAAVRPGNSCPQSTMSTRRLSSTGAREVGR